MKNFLLLFSGIIFIISSCQSNQNTNEVLIKNVTESEFLVSSHDSTLQSMLQDGLQDSIPALTMQTLATLSNHVTELQAVNSSDNKTNDLKKAAIIYVESLIGIVKAQNIYTNYNDTITEENAFTLDYLNIEAVENAQRRQMQYSECLKAVSSR